MDVQDYTCQVLSFLPVFPDLVSSRHVCKLWKNLIDIVLGINNSGNLKPFTYNHLDLVPFRHYSGIHQERYNTIHPRLQDANFSHTIYQMTKVPTSSWIDSLITTETMWPCINLLYVHAPAIKTLTIPQSLYSEQFSEFICNMCPNLKKLVIVCHAPLHYSSYDYEMIQSRSLDIVTVSPRGMRGPSYAQSICFKNHKYSQQIENFDDYAAITADLTIIAERILNDYFEEKQHGQVEVIAAMITDYLFGMPILQIAIESGCQSVLIYRALFDNMLKSNSEHITQQLFFDAFQHKLNFALFSKNREFEVILGVYTTLKENHFISQTPTCAHLFEPANYCSSLPTKLRAERILAMSAVGFVFPDLNFLGTIVDHKMIKCLGLCLLQQDGEILNRNNMEIFPLIGDLISEDKLPHSYARKLFLCKKTVMSRLELEHPEIYNFFYSLTSSAIKKRWFEKKSDNATKKIKY